jgi:hypothetical protein
MGMKCWGCGQPTTRALSVPTIDPTKRMCFKCDAKVKRRPARECLEIKGLFAQFQDGLQDPVHAVD